MIFTRIGRGRVVWPRRSTGLEAGDPTEPDMGTSVVLRLLPCRGSSLTLVNRQRNKHSGSILQVVEKWGQSDDGVVLSGKNSATPAQARIQGTVKLTFTLAANSAAEWMMKSRFSRDLIERRVTV